MPRAYDPYSDDEDEDVDSGYSAGDYAAGALGGAASGATIGQMLLPVPGLGAGLGALGGAAVGLFQTAQNAKQYAAAQEQQAALNRELESRDVYDRILQQQGLLAAKQKEETLLAARQAAARGNLTPGAAAALEQQAAADVNFQLGAERPGMFLAAQQADLARRQQVLAEYETAQALANNAAPTDYSEALGALAQGAALYGTVRGYQSPGAATPDAAAKTTAPTADTRVAAPPTSPEWGTLVPPVGPNPLQPGTGAAQVLSAPTLNPWGDIPLQPAQAQATLGGPDRVAAVPPQQAASIAPSVQPSAPGGIDPAKVRIGPQAGGSAQGSVPGASGVPGVQPPLSQDAASRTYRDPFTPLTPEDLALVPEETKALRDPDLLIRAPRPPSTTVQGGPTALQDPDLTIQAPKPVSAMTSGEMKGIALALVRTGDGDYSGYFRNYDGVVVPWEKLTREEQELYVEQALANAGGR